MPQFTETPKEIESEIKISNYQSLRVSRKADIPLADILAYLKLHPHPSRVDSAWLLTELHERLAAPWTCLVVVLIAIPFGAASGRRNLFVGVAGSIFICFRFFRAPAGRTGTGPQWLAAGVAGGVVAQLDFRRSGLVADGEGKMSFQLLTLSLNGGPQRRASQRKIRDSKPTTDNWNCERRTFQTAVAL